jgi:hypothetical protein
MLPGAVVAIAIVVKVKVPGVKYIVVAQGAHEVCEGIELVQLDQPIIGSRLTELEPEQAVRSPLPPLSLCASLRLRSKHQAH